MCIVSNVYDFGQTIPTKTWDTTSIDGFFKLVEEAKKVDEQTGQADCVDPEKAKLDKKLKKIKKRLKKLEKEKKAAKKLAASESPDRSDYPKVQ